MVSSHNSTTTAPTPRHQERRERTSNSGPSSSNTIGAPRTPKAPNYYLTKEKKEFHHTSYSSISCQLRLNFDPFPIFSLPKPSLKSHSPPLVSPPRVGGSGQTLTVAATHTPTLSLPCRCRTIAREAGMALGPKRGAALSLARERGRATAMRASPTRNGGFCIAMAGSRFQLARSGNAESCGAAAVCPAAGEGEQWRAVAWRVCGSGRWREGLLRGRRCGECRWEGRGRVERVKQPEDVDPASPPATEKSWRQWVDGARDDVALVLRPV